MTPDESGSIAHRGHIDLEFPHTSDRLADHDSEEILALVEAIRHLEEQDAQLGQIVRLRFYAGLSVEETAAALDVSERTVKRRWRLARVWLYGQLADEEA